MIKDVVVQNGLLGIATGTFVCMVGIPDKGLGTSASGDLSTSRASSAQRQTYFA
jgi:hypothetical protein